MSRISEIWQQFPMFPIEPPMGGGTGWSGDQSEPVAVTGRGPFGAGCRKIALKTAVRASFEIGVFSAFPHARKHVLFPEQQFNRADVFAAEKVLDEIAPP
jgi:hypothetical protein